MGMYNTHRGYWSALWEVEFFAYDCNISLENIYDDIRWDLMGQYIYLVVLNIATNLVLSSGCYVDSGLW